MNLFDHGFQPVSFAYPFGSFDAGSQAVVQACGFNSGRGVSGVNGTKCLRRDDPAAGRLRDRTPPNPKQSTTLTTIEGYVTAAAIDTAAGGCSWSSITLLRLRRVFDHGSRLHVAARVVAVPGTRGHGRDDGRGGRGSGPAARAAMT